MDINIPSIANPSMPSSADVEVAAEVAANLAKTKSTNVQEANEVSQVKVVDEVEKTAIEMKEEKDKVTAALDVVVKQLSDVMSMMNKGLAFSVDEDSGAAVVKVMDIDSGEILRQIPSDEALELAQKLLDVKGLLMRTEA
ncbi:flagellar protein FlaG [Shewanella benthica]|uniref:flagellar protein FlaG n=1 Tax=Shewanella benthica TaxID=43661 RepID=UPI00187A57C2|nr:flagellar protein FlaG [Shewanella benthica]MBE7213863.1 flagellar protein FlaG [Shewanella benthica]MBL4817210.1 flagellar protein FlaG [Shewanella sp.]MCL1061769.1 flagellar protein FlaG [Shewanella benthica]